jgi:hypothetical protein
MKNLFDKIALQYKADKETFYPFRILTTYQQAVKELKKLVTICPKISLKEKELIAEFTEENGPQLGYYDPITMDSFVTIFPSRIFFNEQWVWGFRLYLLQQNFFHCDLRELFLDFAYRIAPLLGE